MRTKIYIKKCIKAMISVITVLCVAFIGNKAYAETNMSSIASFGIGDTFMFGSYEQDADEMNGPEPIEWIVLSKENGRVLVISKYGLETLENIMHRLPSNDESDKWENSEIRQWMNGEFLNIAFSEREQDAILLVTVPAHRNPISVNDPGNDTEDKIFSLSIEEAEKYFTSDEERICKPTNYTVSKTGDYCSSYWFLRSPGRGLYSIAFVRSNGAICSDPEDESIRIRPAMWIDVEKYDGLGVKNFFDSYQELENVKYVNYFRSLLDDNYYFFMTKNDGTVDIFSSGPSIHDYKAEYGIESWHDVKKLASWAQDNAPSFAISDDGELLISEIEKEVIKCEIPESAKHGIKDIIRPYGLNQLIIMFEDGTSQTYTLNRAEQNEGFSIQRDLLLASNGIRSYSLDIRGTLNWIDGNGMAFWANQYDGGEYPLWQDENLDDIWCCSDGWYSATIAKRRDGSTVVDTPLESDRERIEALTGIKDVHLISDGYLTILFDDGSVMIERFFGSPTGRYDTSSIKTADRILADYTNPIIVDSDGNALGYSIINSEDIKMKRLFDTHGHQLKDAFMIIDENKSTEYFGLTKDGHIIKIDVIEEPY